MGDSDLLQFLSAFREAAPAMAAPRATAPAGPVIAPPAPVGVPAVPRGPAAAAAATSGAGAVGAMAGPTWALSSPPPPASPSRPRRGHMWERIIAASVVVVTAAVLTLVAVRNDDAANKWRRLDEAQLRISAAASQQITTANANIAQLNTEVKSLDSQISSIQGQLSNVANQKEKAIDQTTVFKDLLAAAGQVANNLQDCISSTNQLDADVNAAVASGDVAALGPLRSEASAVASVCAQAQAGNNALQAAIQSGS